MPPSPLQPVPSPSSGKMNKSISDFRHMFGTGLSSPTRYAVTMATGTQVFPEAITLPSRSFSLFTDGMYGTIRQYPYRRLYNDQIVMTFPLENSQETRANVEEWMDSIITYTEDIVPANIPAGDYNMFILMLDQNDNPTGQYSLKGAYPFSIIPANYGYGMLNEYAKIQITYNYRNYKFELI